MKPRDVINSKDQNLYFHRPEKLSSENRTAGYNKMWCLKYFATPVYEESRFEGGIIQKNKSPTRKYL